MREIYPIIHDTFYKRANKPFYKREAARAFLFKNNKFCLLHILGDDKFGKRNHYETPGGGVENNENLVDTLKREMREETGFTIKNIQEIGKISIEYALLNRIDVENYFYCEADSNTGTQLLDYEKKLCFEMNWFTIDEAIDMYKSNPSNLCGKMIHERDYNALLYLKEQLNNGEIKKGSV